ncbi:hypothetical protein GGR50DRAFT_642501 [Xylaria sp. CBS 124048]|nr:hypothetical protein GGR50DRAFT_642501 [Xylaria sp. CBS 124048]
MMMVMVMAAVMMMATMMMMMMEIALQNRDSPLRNQARDRGDLVRETSEEAATYYLFSKPPGMLVGFSVLCLRGLNPAHP